MRKGARAGGLESVDIPRHCINVLISGQGVLSEYNDEPSGARRLGVAGSLRHGAQAAPAGGAGGEALCLADAEERDGEHVDDVRRDAREAVRLAGHEPADDQRLGPSEGAARRARGDLLRGVLAPALEQGEQLGALGIGQGRGAAAGDRRLDQRDVGEGRPAGEEAEQRRGAVAQVRRPRSLRRDRLGDRLSRLLEGRLDGRRQALVLAGEEVVEGLAGDAGGLADVLHRRRLESLRGAALRHPDEDPFVLGVGGYRLHDSETRLYTPRRGFKTLSYRIDKGRLRRGPPRSALWSDLSDAAPRDAPGLVDADVGGECELGGLDGDLRQLLLPVGAQAAADEHPDAADDRFFGDRGLSGRSVLGAPQACAQPRGEAGDHLPVHRLSLLATAQRLGRQAADRSRLLGGELEGGAYCRRHGRRPAKLRAGGVEAMLEKREGPLEGGGEVVVRPPYAGFPQPRGDRLVASWRLRRRQLPCRRD